MKRTILFLSLAMISIAASAQIVAPQKASGKFIRMNKHDHSVQSQVADTVWTYYNRGTAFYVYSNTQGGYVYGPAKYNGVALSDMTANHYDGVGNATVTSVLLWVGTDAMTVVPPSDSIHIRIYDVATDSTPTTQLGSVGLITNDLDTTGFLTYVDNINAPISSSYLVAVDYTGINDTFGLVCSDPTTHDGKGEKRARQKLSTPLSGKWMAVDNLYQGGQDADVMIIPVLDLTIGVNEFRNELFSLKPVSPNPSNGLVSLEYTLSKAAQVSYNVMDMTGKIVFRKSSEVKAPSTYREKIDLTAFAGGKYFVTFNAGPKTITQQMVISR